MSASIIRARTILTEPADRRYWRQTENGAVLQRDGVIVEIGPAAELIAKHPEVSLLGNGRQVLLPGFVNAHHHIGLTPVQLGSPDMPLELWFVTRLVMRRGHKCGACAGDGWPRRIRGSASRRARRWR